MQLPDDLRPLVDEEVAEKLSCFLSYVREILDEKTYESLVRNLVSIMSQRPERTPALSFYMSPWTSKDMSKIRKMVRRAVDLSIADESLRNKVKEAIYKYIT